jgi:hypothetical protein
VESLLGFERRLCPRLRELGRLAAVELLGECVLELFALAVALLLDPVDTVNGGLRACVGLLRSPFGCCGLLLGALGVLARLSVSSSDCSRARCASRACASAWSRGHAPPTRLERRGPRPLPGESGCFVRGGLGGGLRGGRGLGAGERVWAPRWVSSSRTSASLARASAACSRSAAACARALASSAAFSAASAASSACIRSPRATASYWAA